MKSLQEFIIEQVQSKQLTPEEAYTYLKQIGQPAPSAQVIEWAIIGMACRFPGSQNPEEFWTQLLNRKDAVTAFPKNRMEDIKYVNSAIFEQTKGLNCRAGAYLDRIDLFDHTFFGLTPVEARVMDPAQRLFLEVAIEALDHACLTESQLRGSKTGIYIGYSVNEDNYIDILDKNDSSVSLGNQPALLAYRLSYLFDLKGPTMLIDTSCSASLVAVHQACQAIKDGDCEQAIVGGVNIRFFPALREIANLGIEAFDGKCKTFDEKANGTNIGDGVAALVIKRRDLAERDGDYIHAMIKGSAVNSDGTSNGITTPNPEAQTDVICQAWEKARINPEQLSFIETHGTGTKLGDPIEVTGLTYAFRKYTEKTNFCPLGAVKTNIGHLEAASGIAGLIKAILCLKHRQLPPNIHFNKPNPFIDFDQSPVFPNHQLLSFHTASPLLAGVSSFGISGTNCHLVLEEYPMQIPNIYSEDPYLLFISAKDPTALHLLLKRYAHYLQTVSDDLLAHIAYTSAVGRNHYSHRLVMMGKTCQEFVQQITAYLNHKEKDRFQNDPLHRLFYHTITDSAPLWHAPSELQQLLKKSLIHEISSYFNGQSVNWTTIFGEKNKQKVAIPVYAFNAKRHWPKLEVEIPQEKQSRLQDLFFSLDWKEESKNKEGNVELIDPQLSVLFLMQAIPEHQKFSDFCKAKGMNVIQVFAGDHFEQVNQSSFTIRPHIPSDYSQLLHQLSLDKLAGMIHLWDCLPSSCSMESYEAISHSQDRSAFSCFHLIRACQKQLTSKELKFINITAYAQSIDGQEPFIDPTRMAALGINKVISQEFPQVQSLAIDIDIHNYSEQMAQNLYQDIFESLTYSDPFIGYRNGKRYVQILHSLDISHLPSPSFMIREGGVYLIAGGGGYLGLETALLLAKKAKVKIALIGRKPESHLTDKPLRIIKHLQELGSEVLYLSGDITDQQECSGFIQQIENQWGSIHGIFVAIKNVNHTVIEKVSFDIFRHNVLSKLRVIWLLDQLTLHHPLDFMATFSSISSLMGGPTGADCCAQNLFLDSYGDFRNKQGRKTITMNYTLIDADDGSLLSDRMSMIPPITKEEFIECLDLFLSYALPFAVVADFDSHVMNLVLPFIKIRFSEELLRKFKGHSIDSQPKIIHSHSLQSDLSPQEIKAILIQIWKDVLGHSHIADSDNFFDSGGDSISAVKLTHLAKTQLQIPLEVSDLYSHSTLDLFCHHCKKKLYGENQKDTISQLLIDIDSGLIDLDKAAQLLR